MKASASQVAILRGANAYCEVAKSLDSPEAAYTLLELKGLAKPEFQDGVLHSAKKYRTEIGKKKTLHSSVGVRHAYAAQHSMQTHCGSCLESVVPALAKSHVADLVERALASGATSSSIAALTGVPTTTGKSFFCQTV